MSTNYQARGQILTLIATGTVTAGTPVIYGGSFVIPITSAVSTGTFTAYRAGEFTLTKEAGTAVASGDVAYWDSTNEHVELADAVDNRKIGAFAAAALSSATSCSVALDAVSFGAGNDDIEAKVDIADLASTSNGKGASLSGIEDALGLFTGTTVEAALAEILISYVAKFDRTEVTIASGASSGASAADSDWINANITSCVPTTGASDAIVELVSVDGSGAVTVNCASNQTALVTYTVGGRLA